MCKGSTSTAPLLNQMRNKRLSLHLTGKQEGEEAGQIPANHFINQKLVLLSAEARRLGSSLGGGRWTSSRAQSGGLPGGQGAASAPSEVRWFTEVRAGGTAQPRGAGLSRNTRQGPGGSQTLGHSPAHSTLPAGVMSRELLPLLHLHPSSKSNTYLQVPKHGRRLSPCHHLHDLLPENLHPHPISRKLLPMLQVSAQACGFRDPPPHAQAPCSPRAAKAPSPIPLALWRCTTVPSYYLDSWPSPRSGEQCQGRDRHFAHLCAQSSALGNDRLFCDVCSWGTGQGTTRTGDREPGYGFRARTVAGCGDDAPSQGLDKPWLTDQIQSTSCFGMAQE